MSVSQRTFGRELSEPVFTRARVVAGLLGLLAIVLVVLIAHDVFFPPAPGLAAARTAVVQTGTVSSAVTGTGTMVPMTQMNVGFGEAGTLAEIDVKVGDQVHQGQALARLDPTTFQTALDQANAGLQQAQANLTTTLNGNALTAASHSLAAVQQALTDAQNQVNYTNQQDANAVSADQSQLNADQAAAPSQAQLQADQNAVDSARTGLQACLQTPPATDPSCSAPQALLQADQNKLSADQAAAARVGQDQAKLSADQAKQTGDQMAGQRSIDQATASVTQSQDQLNSQTISRPNTIASQQAAVSTAQVQVNTAQRNLNNAALTAPIDGTVISLSGEVGENAPAGAGATAQAPGSSAPQPSSSGATTASGAAASSSGSFMVISNASALQVVAPFAEADAARLQANQQATVTFDAISGLTLPAHVLAVAGGATVISNVTDYYATLLLDSQDGRLRSGMTANASVTVSQAGNVLTVPNSAITRVGTNAFVTVLGRDGRTQTRQRIQTGTVGDSATEVVSGLNAGDRVVLPQLRATTTAGGGARGLGGGGGAVRIGGGG